MTDVVDKDLAYWRTLAVQTGERLQIAETQLKDLRMAADEARARVTKYKGRLDNANERVNDLQIKLIAISAERDAANERIRMLDADFSARLANHETVKRKIHEYRQSLIDGPIWEVFSEFCRDVGSKDPADGGTR
jgi:chromosome segregation ATPase